MIYKAPTSIKKSGPRFNVTQSEAVRRVARCGLHQKTVGKNIRSNRELATLQRSHSTGTVSFIAANAVLYCHFFSSDKRPPVVSRSIFGIQLRPRIIFRDVTRLTSPTVQPCKANTKAESQEKNNNTIFAAIFSLK